MYNSQLRARCNAVIRSLILLHRSRTGKRFKVRNCCYTHVSCKAKDCLVAREVRLKFHSTTYSQQVNLKAYRVGNFYYCLYFPNCLFFFLSREFDFLIRDFHFGHYGAPICLLCLLVFLLFRMSSF